MAEVRDEACMTMPSVQWAHPPVILEKNAWRVDCAGGVLGGETGFPADPREDDAEVEAFDRPVRGARTLVLGATGVLALALTPIAGIRPVLTFGFASFVNPGFPAAFAAVTVALRPTTAFCILWVPG